EQDPVEYLILRKYPPYSAFARNRLAYPLPADPQVATETERVAQEYREYLHSLPQAEISRLIREARKAEADSAAERKAAEERKLFFHQPEANAEFGYWASASFWSLDEITALSFEKDPRLVAWDQVKQYV